MIVVGFAKSCHILSDPVAKLEFMERIANVVPFSWIDIDEMASNLDQFLERYGWSPSGTNAVKIQIKIGIFILY